MFLVTGQIGKKIFNEDSVTADALIAAFGGKVAEFFNNKKSIMFRHSPHLVKVAKDGGKTFPTGYNFSPLIRANLDGNQVDIRYFTNRNGSMATGYKYLPDRISILKRSESDVIQFGKAKELALFFLLHTYCTDSPFASSVRKYYVHDTVRLSKENAAAQDMLIDILMDLKIQRDSDPAGQLSFALGYKAKGKGKARALNVNASSSPEQVYMELVKAAKDDTRLYLENQNNENTRIWGMVSIGVQKGGIVTQKQGALTIYSWRESGAIILKTAGTDPQTELASFITSNKDTMLEYLKANIK